MKERLRRVCRRACEPVAAAVPAALALGGCAAEYPQTTFRPVTDFGASINDVLTGAFWLMLVILLVVEVLLVYAIVRFRARPGQPEPRQVYGSTRLEVIWTLVPAVIVALIAVPTVRTIFAINAPAPEDAVVVDVVGHQWWWEFRYPQYDVVTANELRLPVGRPVHLQLRSADVVHSFWIPRIGGKRDTNPIPASAVADGTGLNHLTFTIEEAGVYTGQCAEYCGLAHALMAMRIVALEEGAFEAWIASMTAPPPAPPAGSPAAQGRDVFLRSSCIACHTIRGTTARGAIGPNLTRFGERATIGAGTIENTADNLARWIRHPQSVKPGTLMPGTLEGAAGLPPTGLSDEEVEAVAAYLLSLGAADAPPPAAVGDATSQQARAASLDGRN